LHLEPTLSVSLVVTGSLQLGALVTRIAGRKQAALGIAGANAVLGLALTLFGFWGGPARENVVFGALEAAVAGAVAIGLARRRESGWLFWPVWLWNFVIVYALVYLKFFFRVYF
jgi:hypothetical protein